MKQMIIEMPILVKKAGKKVVDGRTNKNKFKFNKKGKLTRGEKMRLRKLVKTSSTGSLPRIILEWMKTWKYLPS